MNYPIYNTQKNPSVTTRAFSGICRLPAGAEGEGTEVRGLSLSAYPVLCSRGFERLGQLFVKDVDENSAIDAAGLQCIADVTETDGGYLLTGVYNGVFYYEGAAVEYKGSPGSDFELAPEDRVEIVRAGDIYIILAAKSNARGSSAIWTYSVEGTSFGTEYDREGDGCLRSQQLSLMLPPRHIESGYLYKISDNSRTKGDINKFEECTGKSYYMLFLRNARKASDSSGSVSIDSYEREAYSVYDDYAGMYGAVMYLKPELPEGYSFDSEKYCFDDFEAEHPVRFVIDAAGAAEKTSTGTEAAQYNALTENESARYEKIRINGYTAAPGLSAGWLKGVEYDSGFDKGGADITDRVYVTVYYGEETDSAADEYGYLVNAALGGGIIGHFEKWNEDKKRYEPHRDEEQSLASGAMINAVYRVTDADKLTATRYKTDGSEGISQTVIPIKAAGIITEASELAHITLWNNRTAGVTADGKLVMISALGEYTQFSEYAGAETDSGYISSGTGGAYTAIAEYNGALLAFKKECIEVYYGTSPQDISLSGVIRGVGCIDSRSAVEVDGVLYFLSGDGFYAYNGARPKCISRKLAEKHTNAVSYRDGHCYCAVCENETLIYDTEVGGWTTAEVIGTQVLDGVTADENGVLYKPSADENTRWCWESCEIYEDVSDFKGIEELYIRAKLSGSMTVSTASDQEEREHRTIEDTGERQKVWRVSVRMRNADAYRIKLKGEGTVTIYAIERVVYAGGRAR